MELIHIGDKLHTEIVIMKIIIQRWYKKEKNEKDLRLGKGIKEQLIIQIQLDQ